jgi:GxxExxY protein
LRFNVVMNSEPSFRENEIAKAVVDAAFKVHKKLGPGLLESVYEICLAHELGKSGLCVRRQAALPVHYDGIKVDAGFRLDLIVEEAIIVEVKAAEELHPVFRAQLYTYLKLTGKRLGLLINFNVQFLKTGIRRVICSDENTNSDESES